jgi:hypothetical protein
LEFFLSELDQGLKIAVMEGVFIPKIESRKTCDEKFVDLFCHAP